MARLDVSIPASLTRAANSSSSPARTSYVANLVGAILLARATAGTALPERILESTHKAMTAPREPEQEL
ncbi:hypothetical protein ABZ178_16145 [Streptomyces massasporeus]|uniref:hypothetical protein n=1 Tax=Streptomyces massasporeus TaxID=67324 RepID=UPI0033B83ECC